MSSEECMKFEELLYDFADDLLDSSERLKVEEHCTQCVDCSAIVAEIRMVTNVAESMPALEPPADKMWLAINNLIKDEEKAAVSVKEPMVASAGVLAGFFSSVYSQMRHLRIVAVPALVTAFVLLAIFPFWIPEGTNPLLPDYKSAADPSVFIESDSVGREMSEASSEARWDLLENAFSDVMLDEVTSDSYSGWYIK